MRSGPVSRNYAETLLLLAQRHDAVPAYGAWLDAVAGALATEPRFVAVLSSPRVRKERKKQLLRDALGASAPTPFVRFLESVVQRGRQGLLREIAQVYEELVDVHLGRVHAGVTTAHPPAPDLEAAIGAALSRMAGKEVLPHFRTDPGLLGGIIVRIGDRVLDGSLRRRLQLLRYKMLHARADGGA